MPAERRGVLLDTKTMLWLLAGDERLSDVARSVIGDPRERLVVSTVSVWEVTIKRSSGRLRAPSDLARRLAATGLVELLPISPLHAEAVGRLRLRDDDIFIRMLATQALAERLAIVSSDEALAEYGVEIIW